MSQRSSSVPVRASIVSKTKSSKPPEKDAPASHIPRPRGRSSSDDRMSNARQTMGKSMIAVGKTPQRAMRPSSSHASPGHQMSRFTTCASPGSLLCTQSPSVKDPRKDCRPLQDKDYQAEMYSQIDKYFRSLGMHDMIPDTWWKNISIKMFVEMSKNLLDKFSVRNNLTQSNYVEELPKIANLLHYKGNVKASWLKTVNTLHSMPHALGWLSFLVNLAEIKDQSLAHTRIGNTSYYYGETEVQKDDKKKILDLAIRCYQIFNETESADTTVQADEVKRQYFQDKEISLGVRDEDMEQLQKEIAEDERKLAELEEEYDAVLKVNERLKGESKQAQRSKDTCLRDMNKEEGNLQKIQSDTEKALEEIEVLNVTIKEEKQRKLELQKTIKEQPMSTAGRQQILDRCMEIQNEILQIENICEAIQNAKDTREKQLVKIQSEIKKKIQVYNDRIVKFYDVLKLMNIDIETLHLPVSNLSDPTVLEEMKKKLITLQRLANDVNLVDKSVSAAIVKMQIETENLEKEINESSAKHDKCIAEEETLIAEKQKMQEAFEKQKSVLEALIMKSKNEMEQIKESAPNCTAMEKDIEEAKVKLQTLQQQLVDYKEHYARFFNVIATQENKYDETTSAQLNRLKKGLEKNVQKKDKLPGPLN